MNWKAWRVMNPWFIVGLTLMVASVELFVLGLAGSDSPDVKGIELVASIPIGGFSAFSTIKGAIKITEKLRKERGKKGGKVSR